MTRQAAIDSAFGAFENVERYQLIRAVFACLEEGEDLAAIAVALVAVESRIEDILDEMKYPTKDYPDR